VLRRRWSWSWCVGCLPSLRDEGGVFFVCGVALPFRSRRRGEVGAFLAALPLEEDVARGGFVVLGLATQIPLPAIRIIPRMGVAIGWAMLRLDRFAAGDPRCIVRAGTAHEVGPGRSHSVCDNSDHVIVLILHRLDQRVRVKVFIWVGVGRIRLSAREVRFKHCDKQDHAPAISNLLLSLHSENLAVPLILF
jgi:hypothetical protein